MAELIKEKNIGIGEAAKYLGVSKDTLRRWDKSGKLVPKRSPTNRRYYTKEQLDAAIKKPKEEKKEVTKTAITKKPIPAGPTAPSRTAKALRPAQEKQKKLLSRGALINTIIFGSFGFVLAILLGLIFQLLFFG